jgi:hypothetical protein
MRYLAKHLSGHEYIYCSEMDKIITYIKIFCKKY